MTDFQGPVHVNVRPSRRVAFIAMLAHLAAALATVWTYPFSWAQCLLLGVIALSGANATMRHLRGGANDVAAVLLGTDDTWRVTFRNAESAAAVPCAPPYVTPWLMVIPLALDDGRVLRVVLFDDPADADARRRLRVRLSHGSAGQ